MPNRMWHFASVNRRGIPILGYDDSRTIKAGGTLTIDGRPKVCRRGLHACPQLLEALLYAEQKSCLCLVELGGDMDRGEDKYAAQKRKVIAMLRSGETYKLMREFAVWCAGAVGHLITEEGAHVVPGRAGYHAFMAKEAVENKSDYDAAWCAHTRAIAALVEESVYKNTATGPNASEVLRTATVRFYRDRFNEAFERMALDMMGMSSKNEEYSVGLRPDEVGTYWYTGTYPEIYAPEEYDGPCEVRTSVNGGFIVDIIASCDYYRIEDMPGDFYKLNRRDVVRAHA